ncbi:MAG: hypothetical protein ABI232_05845 [Jatrophihabitantaceae bacterium]
MSLRGAEPDQGHLSGVQHAGRAFIAVFHRFAAVRWLVLFVVVLLAWLLLFWLVNMPTDVSTSPVTTVVPSNAL